MLTSQILRKVFPAFCDIDRQKPSEFLYIADDKVPFLSAIAVSIQHVIVVLTGLVFTVVLGQSLGLDGDELRGYISLEILVMGIMTLLHSLKTPFSSGHLIVANPSALSIATTILVAASYGLGAVMGALIVSGLVVLFLSSFMQKLRSLFPPEVLGVQLLVLGLSLVEAGVTRATGFDGDVISTAAMISAAATLLLIILLSIWAPQKFRLYAVLAGITTGLWIAALTTGFESSQWHIVDFEPLVKLPLSNYSIPSPEFHLGAILPILLLMFIRGIDTIGNTVALDKMTNARWYRADIDAISRSIRCHGAGLMLSGFLGTQDNGTSSANVGLVEASGIAARSVGTYTGLILILLAFFPKISVLMTLIPEPVVGAVMLYTAAFLIVFGMQIILSRMMNTRRMFIVGFAVIVAMLPITMPDLFKSLSPSMQTLAGSAVAIGVLTAVILNQLFRIGIAQTAVIEVERTNAVSTAITFLEEQGKDWGARYEIIKLAESGMSEALDSIHNNFLSAGKVKVRAKFDEYKLVVELIYTGCAFQQDSDTTLTDLEAFMNSDDDDSLDAIMANVSNAIVKQLADEVSVFQSAGQQGIRLLFHH